MGIDFLKYYDFLFDYRDLREGKSTGMYYKPNTPLEERDYGINGFIKSVPEFGVLDSESFYKAGFFVYQILKDSIAYEEFGFRPGMTITRMSLRGAELRGILSSALFDGGSFDRKFIIPSGLIPRCVHF
ncbi:MAG: hypothetical protein LBD48_01560, partial [Treponema sp.]|nr:hypothetical protein [Treponema sp.]